MPSFIPENIIDNIHDRIDIVEVISSYIPLKRAGRNFKALCPFHSEKTPSFMVSPDKQIFHCFGCKEGGNVFNFVMKYERWEFPEAVRELAKRVGIEVPASVEIDKEGQSLVSALYKANELAVAYYHNQLTSGPQGKRAYQYLKARGITDELIRKFKLGFASAAWEGLLNHAKARSVKAAILEKAGLILSRREGGYYDRFRERIIFPIFDIRTRAVAFGARRLTDAKDDPSPKYINSPETAVYNKGSHLYGLDFAKEQVRDKDCLIIVEGYTDFLSLYGAGIKNVAASLGTALTTKQIKLIRRYTSNVVMIFDGDAAGEAASMRGLDLLIEEGLGVKVVCLPRGFDPDTFISKRGAPGLNQEIEKAKGLFDYKLDILASRYDMSDIDGKVKIAGELLPTIAKVENSIRRGAYIKRLAQEFARGEKSLGEEWILAELKKIRLSSRSAFRVSNNDLSGKLPLRPRTKRSAERMLVGLMLEDASLAGEIRNKLDPADFQDAGFRMIAEVLFRENREGRKIDASRLMTKLSCAFSGGLMSEILANFQEVVDKKKSMHDCIEWIREDARREKLSKLQSQIKLAQNSGNEKDMEKLLTEYNNLVRRKNSGKGEEG